MPSSLPVPLLIAASFMAAFLASCGASDDGAGVGGVTPGEAQALNEAAAMLDERSEQVNSALATGADNSDQ